MSGLTHVGVADDEQSCVGVCDLVLPGFLGPGGSIFDDGALCRRTLGRHFLSPQPKTKTNFSDPKTFRLDYTRLQSMQAIYQLRLQINCYSLLIYISKINVYQNVYI